MPIAYTIDKSWLKFHACKDPQSLEFGLALREWPGKIHSKDLRDLVTSAVTRDLLSWLTKKLQDTYYNKYKDNINKPSLRTDISKYIYFLKLHPAVDLFSNHIEFLATHQAAHTTASTALTVTK